MTRLRITWITAVLLGASAVAGLALPLDSLASSQATTPGAPLVTTAGATHVNPPAATLAGTVDPRRLTTEYWFEYGPTAAYGYRSATGKLAGGTAKVRVSEVVSGVQLDWHYRLVAKNQDGMRDGRDRLLTTKRKSEFVLPPLFHATPVGAAFILNGTLVGPSNANRPIVLQESPYPYRSAYVDVGTPINTDGSGRFSFRVAKLTASTKFRVATVGAKPLYSAVVPELVSVRVTFKVRSVRSAPGLVRVYGTVTPADVGGRVFLQLEKPPKKTEEEAPRGGEKPIRPEKVKKSGKSNKREKHENAEKPPSYLTEFTATVKPGTRALSRFSLIVKVQIPGHYRVLITVRPGPVSAGHSGSVYLHAAPGGGHKKKKKHKR